MKSALRKYGVEDPDRYWREREAAGRTREKRVHRVLLAEIKRLFPRGGNVLDCGVGDGHVFRLSREHYQTYGVEYSPHAIARYDFPTDTIVQADLNRGIPKFPVRFDAIVLSRVLHWFDDPENFLRNAAGSLSANGRLFVVIPNVANYKFRIGYLFGKFPPISLAHKNIQTPRESEDMFVAAGYQIEKIRASKTSLQAKLWPRLFGASILYILKPKLPRN